MDVRMQFWSNGQGKAVDPDSKFPNLPMSYCGQFV